MKITRALCTLVVIALCVQASSSLSAQTNAFPEQPAWITRENAENEARKTRRLAKEAEEQARRARVTTEALEARIAELEAEKQRAAAAAAQEAARARAEQQARILAEQKRQHEEAQRRGYAAATRLAPLALPAPSPVSFLKRSLADGRVVVMAGSERFTFPGEAEAQAFIDSRKAPPASNPFDEFDAKP